MRTRNFVLLVLALTLSASLAGCGGNRTKTLTWWTLPDRVGEEALAQQCSDVARGYRVEVRVLSPLLRDRRADLVRRLSAGDDDIDILTLDSALTAEFAAAKFLAPLPEALRSDAGILETAAESATYRGKLVAVPWWIDPQLLWFRGASAERAGIDTNRPVSWDALLAGADRMRASVQVDDADGTGVSDWVLGLVAESGDASWIPADRHALQVLLETSLLEKAVYELTYELNNRPTWVSVALMGIADLVGDGSSTGV